MLCITVLFHKAEIHQIHNFWLPSHLSVLVKVGALACSQITTNFSIVHRNIVIFESKDNCNPQIYQHTNKKIAEKNTHTQTSTNTVWPPMMREIDGKFYCVYNLNVDYRVE